MGWLTNWFQSWIDWFYARQIALEKKFTELKKELEKMATQDDVDAAINGLKSEVAADFQGLKDQISALQEQISNLPNPSTELDAAVAKINQATAELHSKYSPA